MNTDKIKETKNLDKTRPASLINRFTQSILKMILLSLGFSCTTSCGDLYGTPYADFEMKGKVTNEKGESLSDVEINSVSIVSLAIQHYMNRSTPQSVVTSCISKVLMIGMKAKLLS